MCVCIGGEDRKRLRWREKERQYVSICALHLSVGMSLSRQGEFQDAHGVGGSGGWRELGFGLEAFW